MNTHISRSSDRFHYQLVFKFCIVIYCIILGGCPCIISCVVIYIYIYTYIYCNLWLTCPVLHVWLNGWTNKPNQTQVTLSYFTKCDGYLLSNYVTGWHIQWNWKVLRNTMKELGQHSRFSNKDPNRAIPHTPKYYSLLSVSFMALWRD